MKLKHNKHKAMNNSCKKYYKFQHNYEIGIKIYFWLSLHKEKRKTWIVIVSHFYSKKIILLLWRSVYSSTGVWSKYLPHILILRMFSSNRKMNHMYNGIVDQIYRIWKLLNLHNFFSIILGGTWINILEEYCSS